MMLDGVLKQFRVGFQSEAFHDSVLVESYGSRLQVQDTGNFLHRHTFRKQLQNPLWRRVILFSSAEESPLLKRNSTVSFVISGDRYDSDLRARRIALTNSSAAELFTMYPEAPRRNASAATSGDMFIVR